MACLEHDCNVCGCVWFDNDRHSVCPDCGSNDKRTMSDEQFYHYPEDEVEDEEVEDGPEEHLDV